MKIMDLHGSYDAVFSLGQNCLPSIQLEKNGLRTFSGVLDWMMSDELTDVNRLLENRFQGFMELSNLKMEDSPGVNLLVRDLAYNIISVHDFPTSFNKPNHLNSYPDFKKKLNRRIDRFIQLCATSSRVLFVRMKGTYEETLQLEKALKPYIAGEFNILLINYTSIPTLFDCAWPSERICSVQMSSADIWNSVSDPHWKQLLSGITLR